jgi:hypothetical protein
MDYINDFHNHGQYNERNPILTLFPRSSPEHEITYEDMNPNLESIIGSPKTHKETWFHVPQEEFSYTLHITRAYAKLLGNLPTAS